ncbi:MAG: hypothetical protein K2I43_02355 [Alistipes sp.]|nr:hypothetical protein [Alistipes sp.]
MSLTVLKIFMWMSAVLTALLAALIISTYISDEPVGITVRICLWAGAVANAFNILTFRSNIRRRAAESRGANR